MDPSQPTQTTAARPSAPAEGSIGAAIQRPGVRPAGRSTSGLAAALRRLTPTAEPAPGPGLAYSTGGGGFRSGESRGPAPRGEPSGYRGPSGAGPSGGGVSGGGGGPRMPRGGAPGPRPERYWTDYLRIALPVIGLILMLSLFIFWIGNIISDNDTESTPTVVALTEQSVAPTAAVTPTLPPTVEGGAAETSTVASGAGEAASTEASADASVAEASDGGDAAASDDSAAADESPADEATEEPADSAATFAEGDAVVTSDGGVNLRSDPTTADGNTNILATLEAGTELTVVSGPETADGIEWYEVQPVDGDSGWVSADYLEAA